MHCMVFRNSVELEKNNATPLFDWGKYYIKDGRYFMPLSVQVHHSFADGLHVGKFAQKIQEYLDNL
ncbi:MAG: hypothetical protein GX677_04955 [Treponema sp.]|nr:hypothetical protein [Treponema sp.]